MSASNAFAAVLAGGSGTRMGNPDKPKQFLMLGDKPILIHTVEKFCATGLFDDVLLLCPATWIRQTNDLIHRYCPELEDQITVIAGGRTRNDTVWNAVEHVCRHHEVDDDTVIVTHDAVRPFLTHRIIQENLDAAREYGACDTVFPASDTIVESEDGATISNIPDRKLMYQGQTPQSFKVLKLKALMESLTEEEKHMLSDACRIFVLRDEPVALVMGSASNMKVTYPEDMKIAESFLR